MHSCMHALHLICAPPCMPAGDDKDAGGEIVEIRDEVPELWLLEGAKRVYFTQPDIAALPRGDLTKCAAHWSARAQHSVHPQRPCTGPLRIGHGDSSRGGTGKRASRVLIGQV